MTSTNRFRFRPQVEGFEARIVPAVLTGPGQVTALTAHAGAAPTAVRSYYINTAHTLSASFTSVSSLRADGSVASGTLAQNTGLYINTSHTLSTTFRAGTATAFNPDGCVASGVLAQNTGLYTNASHTLSSVFAAGTRISFRADGSVAGTS